MRKDQIKKDKSNRLIYNITKKQENGSLLSGSFILYALKHRSKFSFVRPKYNLHHNLSAQN